MEKTERIKAFEAEVEQAKAIAEVKMKSADNIILSISAMFECASAVSRAARYFQDQSVMYFESKDKSLNDNPSYKYNKLMGDRLYHAEQIRLIDAKIKEIDKSTGRSTKGGGSYKPDQK